MKDKFERRFIMVTLAIDVVLWSVTFFLTPAPFLYKIITANLVVTMGHLVITWLNLSCITEKLERVFYQSKEKESK